QLTDTITQPVVAVEVFYEPPNPFNRRLVFNKGSAAGIRPGMPVIDEGGVVGQILRVTPYTAEAALLTDENVSIPVQVLRNGLRLVAFGGHTESKIEVRYLTPDVDLQAGDLLITSGIGGLFPAGLPVTRVDDIEHDSSTGFGKAVASPTSRPERDRHFLALLVEASVPSLHDAQRLYESDAFSFSHQSSHRGCTAIGHPPLWTPVQPVADRGLNFSGVASQSVAVADLDTSP